MQLSYIQVVSKLYDTPPAVFTSLPNYEEIAGDYKRLMSFIAAEVPKLEETEDFRAQFTQILELMRPLLEKCPELDELKHCQKLCQEHVKIDVPEHPAAVLNSGIMPAKVRQVDGLAALNNRQMHQPLTKSAVSPLDPQALGEKLAAQMHYDEFPGEPDAFPQHTHIEYARAERAYKIEDFEQRLADIETDRAIAQLDLKNQELQMKITQLKQERDGLQGSLELEKDQYAILEKQVQELMEERREQAQLAEKQIKDAMLLAENKSIVIRGGGFELFTIGLLLCSVGALVVIAFERK